MKVFRPIVLNVAIAAAIACSRAEARTAYSLGLERVASGLSRPVGMAYPPDGSRRLFLIEQYSSRIRILDMATGTLLPVPFVTITGLWTADEHGLRGIAIDPNYAQNRRVYVNVTTFDGVVQIRRYTASEHNPNLADPRGMAVVFSYAQSRDNYGGGWLGFGPDGYLYIATGDGDPLDRANHAQDVASPLGKLLRIDVHPTDPSRLYSVPATNPFVGNGPARPEVWVCGLRDPWRCSFDRGTGNLYIGDIGYDRREEISIQFASSRGGEDYGWPVLEGTYRTGNLWVGTDVLGSRTRPVPPIYEYEYEPGAAVTGGYVYRGSAIKGLQGTYFFADRGWARIGSFRYDGRRVTELTDRTEELDPAPRRIGQVSSFGEDEDGELYILDSSDGEVYKIVPALSRRTDK
ncbi:MAG TPA: PQQ-dependent sugar dehydrogenase [Sedimentisphaerales bacterium]|jgi:glucose/arabinose dehydrogenase|nr:PQQ-dependent sugar dehydrogenase [Sedimentisphaerales bacterium]HNU27656.1 PQQ-dependent sugar dehydrogenase [Sedimentisphaerales bacterium]